MDSSGNSSLEFRATSCVECWSELGVFVGLKNSRVVGPVDSNTPAERRQPMSIFFEKTITLNYYRDFLKPININT